MSCKLNFFPKSTNINQMQSFLDEIQNLSIHDPSLKITREEIAKEGCVRTKYVISFEGPGKSVIDEALPERSWVPDCMDDVAPSTIEWIFMTRQEQKDFLDKEMDEYWSAKPVS